MERMQLRVVVDVDALYEWNGADCAEKSVAPLRWTIEMGLGFCSASLDPAASFAPFVLLVGELLWAI